MKKIYKIIGLLAFTLGSLQSFAQNFSSSTLQGTDLVNPTSLQFGPDGRLYAMQQDGTIRAFTITRQSATSYKVTATETISLVKEIPNHNDDGTPYKQTSAKRQSTSIAIAGTEASPIIYAISSDPRIGGGSSGDLNLCTNSGILSKLEKNGGTWKKTDLVRGLPRSEETHGCNGMYLQGNKMLIAVGGMTNAGAPSNVFAEICEYALTGAILSVDLSAVEAMPLKTDVTGKHPYKYDIPTLDDPTRQNNPDGTDINDPFGGNDGLNQAKLIPGGPVQVFASGFRNPYDVLVLQHPNRAGKIFSIDNGPNKNWGGTPINNTNQYSTAEPGSADVGNFDGLEYIGNFSSYKAGDFYGGHPNPIRANPNGAGIYTSAPKDSPIGSGWRNNNDNINLPLPEDWPPVPASLADTRESQYLKAGTAADKSLLYFDNSTDGICEYRYSGNVLHGDILAAGFDGNLYRIKLNDAGEVLNSKDANRLNMDNPLASELGGKALDVTAQGDGEIFEGTIWVAVYSQHTIQVFEPAPITCSGNNTSTTQDDDFDGYSNAEETLNGTDPCNAGERPADFDKDRISDKIDNDDDNDGIDDKIDYFAIDKSNGNNNKIPKTFDFLNAGGAGFFGIGFTGLMSNGKTNYQDLFKNSNIIAGGAIGAITFEEVPAGDALGDQNDQQFAFQVGVNTNSSSGPFAVKTGILPNYFDATTPENYQSQGMYIGVGDQDNYIKMALNSNNGIGGIELVVEDNGVATSYQNPLPDGITTTGITFYLSVDPTSGTVYPRYEIDGGIYAFNTITATGKLLETIQDTDNALALGIIATSRGATKRFSATWDYIEITPGIITSIFNSDGQGSTSNFSLYPNPAQNTLNLNINNTNNKGYSLVVLNSLNQTIKTQHLSNITSGVDYPVNISDLETGIYYLQLISDSEEKSSVVKFIKQ